MVWERESTRAELIRNDNFAEWPGLSLLTVIVLTVLCSAGCGTKLLSELGEVSEIKNQLIKEFHEPDLQVTLNNSTGLHVTFVNSPLNERNSDERFARAQEAALFVKRRYAGIERLKYMSIGFVKSQTRMVVVEDMQEVDRFVFNNSASLIGAETDYNPQSAFTDEDDVSIVYNPKNNESEVRITRLQLEGDLNKGVMLSPHFKVRGDATTAGRSAGIPSAVVFTFASFAPEKVFTSDPQLRIVADGQTIFNDKAHNQSVGVDGGNEFLVQGVPLAQFLKMTEAKTVVLSLGGKEYLLSDKNLRSLREMASYASQGRKQ